MTKELCKLCGHDKKLHYVHKYKGIDGSNLSSRSCGAEIAPATPHDMGGLGIAAVIHTCQCSGVAIKTDYKRSLTTGVKILKRLRKKGASLYDINQQKDMNKNIRKSYKQILAGICNRCEKGKIDLNGFNLNCKDCIALINKGGFP